MTIIIVLIAILVGCALGFLVIDIMEYRIEKKLSKLEMEERRTQLEKLKREEH